MPAPPPPERPTLTDPAHRPQGSRAMSCLVFLLAGLLFAVALGVLVFLSMGFAAVVVGVAGAVFGVVLLQYVLCGWWLPRLIREDVDDE